MPPRKETRLTIRIYPSQGSTAISVPPVQTPIYAKPQQTAKGLLFMAIGMFLFVTVDTQAKFLTEAFNPVQIVWVRQIGLFIGVIVLLLMRGTHILQTDHRKLQILRGT
ncbi:MAG: hypothetical protein ACPHQQ_07750, partial [Candidatus Puniceispirillum sp.]